jgi:hypothetical protein
MVFRWAELRYEWDPPSAGPLEDVYAHICDKCGRECGYMLFDPSRRPNLVSPW